MRRRRQGVAVGRYTHKLFSHRKLCRLLLLVMFRERCRSTVKISWKTHELQYGVYCMTDEAPREHAALAVRTVISLSFQAIIRLICDDVTVSLECLFNELVSVHEILISAVYFLNHLVATSKNVGNLLK